MKKEYISQTFREHGFCLTVFNILIDRLLNTSTIFLFIEVALVLGLL